MTDGRNVKISSSSRQGGDASARPRNRAARLDFISREVNARGFVSVEDLVNDLGVSRMTVHRDLDGLQAAGALRKVRGGASAHRSTQFESDLQYRAMAAAAEKKRIAAAAIELMNEGDVIIIDDSTSAFALLPLLEQRLPLTVITNFLPALEHLSHLDGVNVISVGGHYVPRYAAFLGMIAEENLRNLHADVLFASTSSMRGADLFHQDQQVVTTKRAMIESAERRVLLLDHSKIDRVGLHRLCAVEEFTHVVVDEQVPGSSVSMLQDAGVRVIVA